MVDQLATTFRGFKRDDLDIGALRLAVLAPGLTFAGAARQIGRSRRGALIRRKRLEKQIGQRLFERHRNRTVPTDAGLVFIAYARRILALHDELLNCMRSGDYLHDALWLRVNPDPRLTLPQFRSLESHILEMRAARPLKVKESTTGR